MSSKKRTISELTTTTCSQEDSIELLPSIDDVLNSLNPPTTPPNLIQLPDTPNTPIKKKKKIISDYFNQSTKPYVNARTKSIFEKLSKKELEAKLMEVKFLKTVVDNRIQIINEYLEKVENKEDNDSTALMVDNSKLKEELNYKNLTINSLEKKLKSTKFDLDYYIQEAQSANALLLDTERENRMMADRIANLEYELDKEKAKNN